MILAGEGGPKIIAPRSAGMKAVARRSRLIKAAAGGRGSCLYNPQPFGFAEAGRGASSGSRSSVRRGRCSRLTVAAIRPEKGEIVNFSAGKAGSAADIIRRPEVPLKEISP